MALLGKLRINVGSLPVRVHVLQLRAAQELASTEVHPEFSGRVIGSCVLDVPAGDYLVTGRIPGWRPFARRCQVDPSTECVLQLPEPYSAPSPPEHVLKRFALADLPDELPQVQALRFVSMQGWCSRPQGGRGWPLQPLEASTVRLVAARRSEGKLCLDLQAEAATPVLAHIVWKEGEAHLVALPVAPGQPTACTLIFQIAPERVTASAFPASPVVERTVQAILTGDFELAIDYLEKSWPAPDVRDPVTTLGIGLFWNRLGNTQAAWATVDTLEATHVLLPDLSVLLAERLAQAHRWPAALSALLRVRTLGLPIFTEGFALLARRLADCSENGMAQRQMQGHEAERAEAHAVLRLLRHVAAGVDFLAPTLTLRCADATGLWDLAPDVSRVQLLSHVATGPEEVTGEERRPKGRRREIGVVTSDRMHKTRRVEVSWQSKHPKYGKTLWRRTICYVHDEENRSRTGDVVEIMETRKLSKTKHWRLVRILDEREIPEQHRRYRS